MADVWQGTLNRIHPRLCLFRKSDVLIFFVLKSLSFFFLVDICVYMPWKPSLYKEITGYNNKVRLKKIARKFKISIAELEYVLDAKESRTDL